MTLSSLTIRSRLRTSHLGFLFMSCGCCAAFYVTTTLANSMAFTLSASRSLKRLAGITIANGVLHYLGNATATVPCIKKDSQVNLIASSRSSCNCIQFLKPTGNVRPQSLGVLREENVQGSSGFLGCFSAQSR